MISLYNFIAKIYTGMLLKNRNKNVFFSYQDTACFLTRLVLFFRKTTRWIAQDIQIHANLDFCLQIYYTVSSMDTKCILPNNDKNITLEKIKYVNNVICKQIFILLIFKVLRAIDLCIHHYTAKY